MRGIFLRLWSRFTNALLKYVRVPNRRVHVDLDKLLYSINESAKSISAQSLTFLVTAAYVAVSAAGVTDQSFVLHDRINLPIVNVGIPVRSFFFLAPVLLVALHITLLVQEYFLLQKLVRLPWKRTEVNSALFYPSISLSNHFPAEYWFPIGILARVVFWWFLFLMPLAVLVYLQTSSLRYRVDAIRLCVGVCTAVNVFASLCFIVGSDLLKGGNSRLWNRGLSNSLGRFGAKLIILFVLIVLSLFQYLSMIEFQNGCSWEQDRFLWIFPVRRHLVLNEETLSARTPESAWKDIKSLEPDDSRAGSRGIDFRRQDLRCAVFVEARLINADFRGAKLQGALFDGADLQGSDFSAAFFGEPRPPQTTYPRVDLRGASFVKADLYRANLAGADMRETVLRDAILQEASLSRADLSQSDAIRANLVAADLTGARLRGADLREASLQFAKFDDAKIEMARFESARLDKASFAGATTFGASFQNAWLRGTRGLTLHGISLRGAKLWGFDSCDTSFTASNSPPGLSAVPRHVDFRYITFDPINDWQDWVKEIQTPKHGFMNKTMQRMQGLLSAPADGKSPACFAQTTLRLVEPTKPMSEILRTQNLLYDTALPGILFKDWPEQSPLTEEEYKVGLIHGLVEEACKEDSRTPRGYGEPTMRALLKRRASEIDRFGQLLQRHLQETPCGPALRSP